MESLQFDWKEVFDAIHNDLMIADRRGIVVYCNKATETLYGLTAKELLGNSVDELEKRKVFYPSITKIVLKSKQKQTIIQNTIIGTKVLVTGVPLFDSDGNIKFIITYSHDVTEFLRLKEHVVNMQEEMEKVRNQLLELQKQTVLREEMTAVSPAMKQVMMSAEKIADFDVTVLLTGESGVGKNVLAKYIHNQSKRRKKPMVEINCGSIPETLLESELFGYEPGSFSGAHQQGKKGLVESAEGGTLFLDEIGELPLNLQVKLLTLIQEKKFYSVGGTKPRQVNFRLIAATNVDLQQKVKEGKFREDLYFRLSVVPMEIPPLRHRTDDLFPLIRKFTEHFNHMYDQNKKMDQSAIDQLIQYPWPGNVREMQNMIERLVLTAERPIIRAEDLPDMLRASPYSFMDHDEGKSLPAMLDEFEGSIIQRAYAKCKSTVKLAEYLGISQPTAVRKIHKYKDLIPKQEETYTS